jgi:hypothetical protein
MTIARQPRQSCGICGKDLDLRNHKIGQNGRPVHFNCYTAQMVPTTMGQNHETPLVAEPGSPTPGQVSTLALHYHIRWSGHDTLDWERFETRSAAQEGATRLARPGEGYTIEEQGETCPRCASIKGSCAAATANSSP